MSRNSVLATTRKVMDRNSVLATQKQIAREWGCHPDAVKRARKKPELNFPQPTLNFGHPRWRWSDIDAWVEAQAVKVRAQADKAA